MVPNRLIEDQNSLDDLLAQIADLAKTASEYKAEKKRKKVKR
jgi:hypothetical protein